MDRRLFLTGVLGLAGTAAVISVVGPSPAEAGIAPGRGILDQLDESEDTVAELGSEGEATVQQVWHRHWHRPRRRRRRYVTRRVCRRVWRNGRRRVRCWNERIRIFVW